MKKIFVVMILLAITGCGKKEAEIKEPVKDKVEVDVPVSNINQNQKYQEVKKVDGLSFNDASLVSVGETALFEVKVKNTTTSDYNLQSVKINLLDKDNKELQTLTGMVPNGLKTNEEKVISCYYNGKIDNVVDVNYEIIK